MGKRGVGCMYVNGVTKRPSPLFNLIDANKPMNLVPAAVKVPGMPVYLPTRITDASRHAAQMDAILDYIQQIDGPLVLVGDLNMTDQHPAYAALMAHLQDAFVERGRGLGFTFTPFATYELPTWRIDYVLHSPVLTAVDVQIGDFGGSDHKPVLATLALP
ncbi:MAG: endonuclease/exonuclease/phosphatase family protein [Anaerolinea sp.]|nr:endonuclease/exonuclease/phosphatase family protein [Anaerolinea sp.]